MTKDELARLREASLSDPREACMLAIASRHFIRASEFARLRVSDINLRDNTIRITRLKGSISKTEGLKPGERECIEAWLKVRPEQGAYLFPGRTGKRMHRSQVYNIFRALTERAGIPSSSRGFHALRHTLGQHLAEAGAPAKLIQQAAGHKSLNSTGQYYEFTQRHVDTEAAKYLGL